MSLVICSPLTPSPPHPLTQIYPSPNHPLTQIYPSPPWILSNKNPKPIPTRIRVKDSTAALKISAFMS
ncbi:hypothetical protein MC7420_8288 [Coleofasciculus chthonoplastes PCC 7420]|uniref:Uncharacterized protein n=1 Tax=Coleofasciculus chthonoplastes PCC 7420 TaxID=118168 RepID=B4W0P1_9CYAN|nr:hypothetical protein MC7420_8288 [Coleofasciculus chthonoplastes PCC 7420]